MRWFLALISSSAVPHWLQWTSAILGPIGTFITAIALIITVIALRMTIRQGEETRRESQRLRQLVTVVFQKVSDLAPQSVRAAVAEAAKPYVQNAPDLAAALLQLQVAQTDTLPEGFRLGEQPKEN